MTQHKPWTIAAGFAAGGILLAVGIVLQLVVGSVDWSVYAWPVNVYVLGVFVALIVVAHALRDRFRALRFLSSLQAAVPALVCAVALTIVMGLVRQDGAGGWLSDMLSFWPFVIIYVYIAFILGLVTLKRSSLMLRQRRDASAARQRRPRRWLDDAAFLLNHLGLFLALVCATLGNADVQRLKMVTATRTLQWRAIDEQMRVVETPIAIELKRFILETYDDGSPRRFASDIEVVTRTGKDFLATVDVNHPVKVDGWKIYQYDYDAEQGADSQTSVLELVRDPWLPAVYASIFMMLAGALLTFLGINRKEVNA